MEYAGWLGKDIYRNDWPPNSDLTYSDPPSLLSSSELRDISLQPSAISNARITIVHPQLRDLILPVERGRVLYPRGNGIEELRWKVQEHWHADASEDEDMDPFHPGRETLAVSFPICLLLVLYPAHTSDSVYRYLSLPSLSSGSTLSPTVLPEGKQLSLPSPLRILHRELSSTPNIAHALTRNSRGMLAAGGQAGELHISHIPPWLERERLPMAEEIAQRRFWNGPDRPPSINVKLDTGSINNSIVLLPDWPEQWAEVALQRRIGYVGRGGATGREEDRMIPQGVDLAEEDETRMDESGDTDDVDDAMDLDDDDDVNVEPRSPATYPNTVPFLHPPRIPFVPTSSTSSSTSRRASSFSQGRVTQQPPSSSRIARQSFSVPERSAQPPIRIVSSTPGPSRSVSFSSMRPSPTPPPSRRSDPRSDRRPPRTPEPRLLISSNDQTIKMFTIQNVPPSSIRSGSSYERTFEASRLDRPSPVSRSTRGSAGSLNIVSTDWRDYHPGFPPVLPVPPALSIARSPRTDGASFGWEFVGSGSHPSAGMGSHAEAVSMGRRASGSRSSSMIGFDSGLPEYSRGSQAPVPRSAAQAPESGLRASVGDRRDEKRLKQIGGSHFGSPVNHCMSIKRLCHQWRGFL